MTDLGNINSAPLVAFHGSQKEKDAIINQLREHAAADEITKGIYWENGRGCAVGCTIHSRDHALYEPRFGIPQMLARLEDTIFEGLPLASAKTWPIQFMQAIKPGANLSHVGWQFLHRLLTDKTITPGITHPIMKNAITEVAALVAALAKGDPIDAESAAKAAEAAESAAESAESAWSVAERQECCCSADESAWSAARVAESARNAADAVFTSVRSDAGTAAKCAAWSAAKAACSVAESDACSVAVYVSMSNVLIQLLGAA